MPINFFYNDMSVSTVRAVHRLCVLLCFTVSDLTRKCPMLDSYKGAMQGPYGVCRLYVYGVYNGLGVDELY